MPRRATARHPRAHAPHANRSRSRPSPLLRVEEGAAEIHREAERVDEPEIALYSGDDGLDVYRRLVPEAERLLAPNGWLVMELGHTSGEAVSGMLGAWRSIEIRKDLAGLPRVILAQRP